MKDILKINKNCIFSTWLNKSDNYLEDIYYSVCEINKSKKLINALFYTFIFAVISIVFGGIYSILIKLFDETVTSCYINAFYFNCYNFSKLTILLIISILIIILFIIAIYHNFFKNNIAIIKLLNKKNDQDFDELLIERILKKTPEVLVIEDIDRSDNIKDILIALDKISRYIIKKIKDGTNEEKIEYKNKYVLINGDYFRTAIRISNPSEFCTINRNNFEGIPIDNNQFTEGIVTLEKIIGLRMKFLSIEERITSILREDGIIYNNLSDIERDEIITFIKEKVLSVRFFINFSKQINEESKNEVENISLYYKLISYYNDKKIFNASKEENLKSRYNLNNYPNCLNDIELILQSNIDKKRIKYNKHIFDNGTNNNYIKQINNVMYDILFNNKISYIYKKCYIDYNKNEIYKKKYEIEFKEIQNIRNKGNYMPKESLKIQPKYQLFQTQNLKFIHNYLISDYSNINIMQRSTGKRCYFEIYNNEDKFKLPTLYHKIEETQNLEKLEDNKIPEKNIIRYIAAFMNKNKAEIKAHYPELYKNLIKPIESKTIKDLN